VNVVSIPFAAFASRSGGRKRPTEKSFEKTFAQGFKFGWESIAGANIPSPSSGAQTQNYSGGTAYIEGIRMGMEAANDTQRLGSTWELNRRTDI
jgi:hypothetical protein